MYQENHTFFLLIKLAYINQFILSLVLQEGQHVEEFLVPDTHCFTQASIPTSVLLAIGAGCKVTFHSDQSVTSTLDTVSKVMCLEKVDNSLFAGLDTGFIVVISWKVLTFFFFFFC
jgi:hypothetical protein